MNNTDHPPASWVQVTPDQEVLRGNRLGLESLRSAVDAALEKGEGRVTYGSGTLTVVQLDSGSELTEEDRKFSWKAQTSSIAAGAVVLGLLILVLLGLGLIHAFELISK